VQDLEAIHQTAIRGRMTAAQYTDRDALSLSLSLSLSERLVQTAHVGSLETLVDAVIYSQGCGEQQQCLLEHTHPTANTRYNETHRH
jgi:hypothetical protein